MGKTKANPEVTETTEETVEETATAENTNETPSKDSKETKPPTKPPITIKLPPFNETGTKFNKGGFLKSKLFNDYADILKVELSDDETYTKTEVVSIIKEFLNKEVR